MNLSEALKSINTEKVNLIRNSAMPEVVEKQYPSFPVSRSLSYHLDCVLLVNELNIRGLAEFCLSDRMHYEFLLHAVDQKKRFAKWSKPEKNDHIQNIMHALKYSRIKAESVADLVDPEDVKPREGGRN